MTSPSQFSEKLINHVDIASTDIFQDNDIMDIELSNFFWMLSIMGQDGLIKVRTPTDEIHGLFLPAFTDSSLEIELTKQKADSLPLCAACIEDLAGFGEIDCRDLADLIATYEPGISFFHNESHYLLVDATYDIDEDKLVIDFISLDILDMFMIHNDHEICLN